MIATDNYELPKNKEQFFLEISSGKFSTENFKKEFNKITNPKNGLIFRTNPSNSKDLLEALTKKTLTNHPKANKLASQDLKALEERLEKEK